MKLLCRASLFFVIVAGWLLAPLSLWAGDGGGVKIIYVITDDQKLYAWEGNELAYEFDVVTGMPGKVTHAGVFHITRKCEDYTSQTYRSKMPYSMFFTADRKAIHATKLATLRSYLHT